MPRRPREEVEGGVFHVVARGNARQAIFRDDDDRFVYLALLGRAVARTRWSVLAYCLMDNHVHLLIETPERNLGDGMRWFHGHYARRFNDRHDRVGHVFQGRYGAVRQRTDAQLLTAVRYIVRNPVTAGLCRDPAAYRWSSHAAMDGRASSGPVDRERLRWFIGRRGARRRYLALIADQADGEHAAR